MTYERIDCFGYNVWHFGCSVLFGIRKKKVFGAIIPIVMTVLFIIISFYEKTTEYVVTGVVCVAAVIVVWFIGYSKSRKYEKSEIDKMKTKDL